MLVDRNGRELPIQANYVLKAETVSNDERIDVESLALTTQAWLDVCELFLA